VGLERLTSMVQVLVSLANEFASIICTGSISSFKNSAVSICFRLPIHLVVLELEILQRLILGVCGLTTLLLIS
jgi:hypothetical protein